jgi:SPP1 gp7 family putative phage head morphogenesis protein
MSEIELQDSILRMALDLQRLSANDEEEALAILRQLEDELRALLASRQLSGAGKREIEALVKAAEAAIDGRYAGLAGVVDTQGLVLIVAENTVKAMRQVFPARMVSAETLASLARNVLIEGAPTSAWWAKQAEDTAFKFAAAVRQGVVNGDTQERIVSRVTGREGFMEVSRRNARTLVHSSIMSAANQARLATYRKNGKHIAALEWLATLDSHTCTTCAALDGAQWNLDGKAVKGTTLLFRVPPAHHRCRCVLSPVPKSLDDILGTTGLDKRIEELSRRASKDGPVAGNTRFDAFLSRQSPAFIANTLGARRAELYRAGKLTLRDLVSGSGRPLTLDELKAP